MSAEMMTLESTTTRGGIGAEVAAAVRLYGAEDVALGANAQLLRLARSVGAYASEDRAAGFDARDPLLERSPDELRERLVVTLREPLDLLLKERRQRDGLGFAIGDGHKGLSCVTMCDTFRVPPLRSGRQY